MRCVIATITLCSLSGLAPHAVQTALAEPAPSTPARAAGSIEPPTLLHCPSATWPAGQAPNQEVSVLFEMTINLDGNVEDLTVLGSAGEAFDLAASTALAQATFAPARRGTIPIPVRLRYRYVFARVPESTSRHRSSDEQPAALVPHHATSTSSSSPLPGRNSPNPAPSSASTKTETLPSVTTEPRLAMSDPSKLESSESLEHWTPSATELDPDDSYGAVAQISAPPREVTKHTIEQQDLTKIPGTSGDALRAIEVMPGVARTSISSGEPILRGAAWHESRSFIEGTTVPMLYHFGGVKSAFNSRLLSRVELYPGNYGTSFGRVVGGIISARVRDPQRDRLHALTEASVIDSTAMLETPIGTDVAVAIAGRRSNIDYFYNAFAPESSFNVVAAPIYYDYQGIGWMKLDERHQLRVMSYGSRDSMKLIFANPSDFDPALRDKVDFFTAYHRVQAALDSTISSRLTQRVQITYGYTTMRQMIGPIRAELIEHDLMSRGEWSYRSSGEVRINVGYDVEALSMRGYYIGPRPPQAEGEVMNGGMSTESIIDVSNLDPINAVRPAAYTEVEWRPARPLLVVPGVRFDYYSDQGAVTVNPRLSTRYEIHDRFALKWGLGTYSQNPQYYELIADFGNPKLRPYHALHYGIGFEHRPTDSLNWGVEGFCKWIHHRVVSTPGGTPPNFLNDGVGRIYGAELYARYVTSNFRGWLAYTISRSERQDRNDPWRLFEKDQTHILAVTANYQLGRGWELGGRFRLTSGNPYTPVRAAIYDANLGVYRPVNASPFSARDSMFHQLDLRIEKLWQFQRFRIATYLDVQNVYNAKNYEGIDYSYDYSKRQRIAGLPLLPNLGLRGEI